MANRKTALEEIAEKESNFGKVFKVAGPCNSLPLFFKRVLIGSYHFNQSGRGRANDWS